MAYDDDNFGQPQVIHLHLEPNGANVAAEVLARVKFFHRYKINECRLIGLSTAWDNDGSSALTIKIGTTDIGTLVSSAAADGSVVDGSFTGAIGESTDTLEISMVEETQTGQGDFLISYQELFEP